MPSDPSFVMVQVEGARERIRQAMADARDAWDPEMQDLRPMEVQAILEALGLDRPGLRESYLQRAIARTRGDENQHGDLDVSNRLRAALAAAKEVGNG